MIHIKYLLKQLYWISKDTNIWNIQNDNYKIRIKWSKNYFEDYKKLSYNFFECGYLSIDDYQNNANITPLSDMGFFASLFLIRQSLELGLKALICRYCNNNNRIQNTFQSIKHNLTLLFQEVNELSGLPLLSLEEKDWIKKYLDSLEYIDEKSDILRFPFENNFFENYGDSFLDIIDTSNNMIQAFYIIEKCMNDINNTEYIFHNEFEPTFLIFSKPGINFTCYVWSRDLIQEFYCKISGYLFTINCIYNEDFIAIEDKAYPLMFMFRNTLELCFKRFLYKFKNHEREKSHRIIKTLWEKTKAIILTYNNSDKDIIFIEEQLKIIDSIDKEGDTFRYPTSKNLDYTFNNKTIDLKNIYNCFYAIINFIQAYEDAIEYSNE